MSEKIIGEICTEEVLEGEITTEEILTGKLEIDIIKIKGEDGKSPFINENGNWMYFDDKSQTWIESKNDNYYTKKEVDNIIQETILDSWEENI